MTLHRFSSSLLALLMLSGCTANKMYRTTSVETQSDYTLAFVEFDDQGELWDPTQLSRAQAVIDNANQNQQGSIVVTYIHGWQQNASPKSEKNGNVANFKGFLDLIATRMDARQGAARKPLVGIYLGWRGKSGSIPGLNLATFYNRAGAARRIAGTSATEVIYRILATAKQNPASRVLLMGHSFGGQILERAVTQAMVGDLLDPFGTAQGGLPADLVVLINPAAKSIQAKQFVEMLDRSGIELHRQDEAGNTFEVPLMVSITSSADLATRWAFPAGTWISSIGKDFRKYPKDSCLPFEGQRSFYVRTPGHNPALISHNVTATPLAPGQEPVRLDSLDAEWLTTEFDPVTRQNVFSFNGDKSRFTIQPLIGAANNTPYWIMQVPRQLIPGHSGFFTDDTLRLIASIVHLSGMLEPDSTTTIVRRLGVRPYRIEALPDGRVFVIDASRRIYEVETANARPITYGCLPRVAEPTAGIGLALGQSTGYAAVSRLSSGATRKGTDVYENVLMEFHVSDRAIEPGKMLKLQTADHFAVAAFDLDHHRVFLTTAKGQQVDLVDLTEKKPMPRPWVEVGAGSAVTALKYDETARSLFAGTEDGKLYRVTDPEGTPQPSLLAESLGLPVSLALDERHQRLYIGDARGHKIWRMDCPSPESCSAPRSLAGTDSVESFAALAVGADGTLWIADREGEAVVALSPDGEVLQTIRELPK